MAKVHQRAAARSDLVGHFVYLAEHAGLDVAERFIVNAETSFQELAERPMIGIALTLGHPNLTSIRKWHVRDFDNYLVFYQLRDDGVSIVRVLHGAQDWWRLFGWETTSRR